MTIRQNGGGLFLACALAAIGLAQAQNATETVVYSFGQFPRGANPYSPVALDAGGNIYGTTYAGGEENAGVLFKVSATGQETVLHSFTGGPDGGNPYAGVIHASNGNLYCTTYMSSGTPATDSMNCLRVPSATASARWSSSTCVSRYITR